MIRPGLARISKLLADTALPWRAIHVAGTNGKGSVCNYVAAMLDLFNSSQLRDEIKHDKISWAKFTSPHLIDRWDGIQINGQTVDKHAFHQIEAQVMERDHNSKVGASEFELLTATAFEVFKTAKVDIGIVEVGMGGAQDATNILGTDAGLEHRSGIDLQQYRPPPLVTAITRIGLDHQAFLGNSLPEIAAQKAGIIKPGVPVIFDDSNPSEVAAVLTAHAAEHDALVISMQDVLPSAQPSVEQFNMPPFVRDNYSVALRAVYATLNQSMRSGWKDSFPHAYQDYLSSCASVAQTARNPGRMEWTSLNIGGRSIAVLIDGAHNAQSASRLAEALEKHRMQQPLSWLYGASQGRNVEESLQLLLRPGDSVTAAEFGSVDGMPWVKPVPRDEILAAAVRCIPGESGVLSSGKNVLEALRIAANNVPDGGLLVVSGSLYLVGDVHRLLRDGRSLG